jgi:hypothetical protein
MRNGDSRLIAVIIPGHGAGVHLLGVRCDRLDLPIRIVEFTPGDPARARREWAFAENYNRALVALSAYRIAECEPTDVLTRANSRALSDADLDAVEAFGMAFDLPS